jgi:hypothetical protein
MSEKPCIFKLFKLCHVYERANVTNANKVEFGSIEWIQMLCSMCIKSVYARRFKSKMRLMGSKYSVVNTL